MTTADQFEGLEVVGDICLGDGCGQPVAIVVKGPSGLIGLCRACYNRSQREAIAGKMSVAGKVGGRSRSEAKRAAAKANLAKARARRWNRQPLLAQPSQPAPSSQEPNGLRQVS